MILKRFVAWIKAIRAEDRTLSDLARLDHRALRDIGVTESDIPFLAKRIREEVYQTELSSR